MPIQFWAPSCFVIRKLHATTQRKLNSNIPLKLWIVRFELEVGGPVVYGILAFDRLKKPIGLSVNLTQKF